MTGFSWTQRTATPSCFVLTSDAQSFLAWQAAQQPETAYSAASGLSACSVHGEQLPKALCRAPHFEDSDGDSGLLRQSKAALQVIPIGRAMAPLRDPR